MDFLKNAAGKLNSNKDSSESKTDSTADSSAGSSSSSSGGQYDQYISKGVDYGEKQFMGTDVENKTDDVKKRDEKITSFISSNVDKVQGGGSDKSSSS